MRTIKMCLGIYCTRRQCPMVGVECEGIVAPSKCTLIMGNQCHVIVNN